MTCFRWRIVPRPEYPLGNRSPVWDDERRELVEAVLGELGNPALDADGRAACADLLNHLVGAGRKAWPYHSFPAGCSNRSNSWERRGATSVRPPKRHWL